MMYSEKMHETGMLYHQLSSPSACKLIAAFMHLKDFLCYTYLEMFFEMCQYTMLPRRKSLHYPDCDHIWFTHWLRIGTLLSLSTLHIIPQVHPERMRGFHKILRSFYLNLIYRTNSRPGSIDDAATLKIYLEKLCSK